MSSQDNHNGKVKIGVYVCHCGTNIAGKVNVTEVVAFAAKLPYVTVAREYKFMCSDPGQDLIQQDIKEGRINRVVVASCSPLMHEITFRRATEAAGSNPFFFHMANIREHDSWVTADPRAATDKAKALVAAAVRRVYFHESLEKRKVPINPNVLIVGGGIAGIQAALTLADSGKQVYLVEREPSIGGHMAKFDKTFPTLDCASCILTPKMTQVQAHPNITLLTYAEVAAVEGYVGNFNVTVRRKARYVREDLCTGCGECTKVCPVQLPSEFDEGLGIRHAIYRPFPQSVPNTYTISRKGTPPCQAMCSLHQNAQGYIALIAAGKFKEALEVILRDNPLPAICGRICTHPCTTACTRNKLDEPLHIPGLKRFVTDTVGDYELPQPEEERAEHVAVVGSGPSGLMCAFHLRQKGYQVTIFEAADRPGGMLEMGIPRFRLPRKVIQQEIQRILDTGIELRLNTQIGRDISLEELKKKYAAVYLAVGAHREKQLRIPGEELEGVWKGVEFLRRVNQGERLDLGKRILVIGGGNSAIDAARTALRTGAEEVTIVYRRTEQEMPADPAEVAELRRENIKLFFLAAPVKIHGQNRVNALECIRMRLGEPDESGRRRPIPIENSEFTIPCDAVIVTIGQEPVLEPFADELKLKTTRWGTLEVDPLTLATNVPGVFAGGDCVTGPDVVVNAMFAGKKAAISIERLLTGQDLAADREGEGPFQPTFDIDVEGIPVSKQIPMPSLPPEDRRNFKEVHLGYTAEQAQDEAKRCLNCAVCCDCELCSTVCEPHAIDYRMQPEEVQLEVGTILVATGFRTFDARRIPQYQYGRLPNVYTSLEVERLINSSGPTGGKLVLRDGREPKSVGIIHCVGSRDVNYNRYCSRVCCMYSLKLAHLVRERTQAEVYNFYIDMRAFGKGYEEFYDRVLEEGAHMIRGRVAEVTDVALEPNEEGKLIIRVEDTLVGVVRRIPVDMVILSVGLEAQSDAQEIRRLFNISCSSEGFFLERHPKLAPVSTFTDGVFLAGACQGPKDIPDTVAQAGAAAAEALSLIDRGHVELEPNTAWIEEETCSGCQTCLAMCPFNAISYDPEKKISVVNEVLCKGCGTCVSACPSGSAHQHLFLDEEIFAEIEGTLAYV